METLLRFATIVVLFMSSIVLAVSAESTLRIDNAHNAVWETIKDSTGDDDITGSIKGGVDLPRGALVVDATLRPNDAEDLKDVNVHLYSGVINDMLEMIGKIDIIIPDDAYDSEVQLKQLQIDATSVSNIKEYYTDGSFSLSASGIEDWRDADITFDFNSTTS